MTPSETDEPGEATMPWRIVERRIGRAGGVKQRTARQREWDQKYGEGSWPVGYAIDGEFVLQEDALENSSANLLAVRCPGVYLP